MELWSREIGDFFIFLAEERSEPREGGYYSLFSCLVLWAGIDREGEEKKTQSIIGGGQYNFQVYRGGKLHDQKAKKAVKTAKQISSLTNKTENGATNPLTLIFFSLQKTLLSSPSLTIDKTHQTQSHSPNLHK